MQEEMIYMIIIAIALGAIIYLATDPRLSEKKTISRRIGHSCRGKVDPKLIPPKRNSGSGVLDLKDFRYIDEIHDDPEMIKAAEEFLGIKKAEPKKAQKYVFWETTAQNDVFRKEWGRYLEVNIPSKKQTTGENTMIKKLVIDTAELLQKAGLDSSKSAEILDRLDEMNFFTAPASTTFHGAYMGGLAEHSLNVARTLAELAEKAGIKWQNERSPYIIGLFHDLCKCDQYVLKETGEGYEYSNKKLLDGHGAKSAMLAGTLLQLTEEEMLCIRYHMGSYQKEDWTGYDLAIKKYPSVLFTHTADMIASKLQEG